MKQGRPEMGNKKGKTPQEPRETENRRQHTRQRPHIKSIPTKIQRLLHSRTFGKEPGGNQGQQWPHNKDRP